MGRGRPRAVQKGVLGQNSTCVSSHGSLNIPQGPIYYPTEEEFRDPLDFIYKIRPEAEQYGICKIVPPKNWKPPFALDLNSFVFPTKTQAIHQLQARSAPCDPRTFELEYNRFLEEHCARKGKKRVVFEGEELDFCKLFNAVKRFGGYDKVVKEKKWGEVFRFVRSGGKITECAKHVLSQLYLEHLCDYEEYYNQLNRAKDKVHKRRNRSEKLSDRESDFSSSKRRRKNNEAKRIQMCEAKEEEHDQICEQCKSGLHGEVMLLCDRCNKGWHIYCLSPPLKRVPPGNWYCLECLNSEKDSFGFVPGKQFSLEAFRRVADRAKRKWFGSQSLSRVQLEKKFWEIVEGSVGEVEVMYGSDLDTSVYGSGFPRPADQKLPSVGTEIWDEYCGSPWNLNNLPKLNGSVLRAVHDNIAGVMVPWLYVGMLFSSFCWHFEDHCFYSMNYLHWGEPKCWYSVPGSEASAFEKVMRNSLPDLFDAQPDLLFQLVTMLNPSVLQANGVPVYSVLQEPGNFIITFPRSYHGGFNFGLNCAEAVNFAPADWLPHGGFAAELYQLYRKPAVLSHEELLCVVARSEFDSKIFPYLKTELFRVYNKEKSWREQIWRSGIISSSPMSPRMSPEYVGTEEDPTCIICQQILYLSAVVCSCRPSAFVCLEHWEHLCECKPSKHRILYRHTLAELNVFVLTANKDSAKETSRSLRGQLQCSSDAAGLSKKGKSGYITHVQLAEEWILKCSKMLKSPYAPDAYVNALKEAEQFLWAGSEMDPVREMAKNLVEAQNWAIAVRECLSNVECWSSDCEQDMKKVQMEHVNQLLRRDPKPCLEPAHLKLKDYQKGAMELIQEIDCALSACSKVSVADLEILYLKTLVSPIHVKESEKLLKKLSSAKVLVDSIRKLISKKPPDLIEADIVYALNGQISELQIPIPEGEMLLDIIRKVECCQSQCIEILKGPVRLKTLELLLKDWEDFAVNISELKLLRQYHTDAVSWLFRVNHVLANVSEREDQENVVRELTCIQRDASLLKIQVEELADVDLELKRASCRVKALKARRCKMPVGFIEQLMVEASILQVGKEKIFADVHQVLTAAECWEERARHAFESEAEMSEFEDLIRSSEDIHVMLPSLDDVKNAVSVAKSWLLKSKPFLLQDSAVVPATNPSLKVEALKELVSEAKLLNISMIQRKMLEKALKNCSDWELDAQSLLNDAECLLNRDNLGDAPSSITISDIEQKLSLVESSIRTGLCLGFGFEVIPKLQDISSTLRWCSKAMSFCGVIPTLQEVNALLEVASHLSIAYTTCTFYMSLLDGINWLKKALEILFGPRQFKLSDAEEVIGQSQKICGSFPMIGPQLQKAIEKHIIWVEQVRNFLSLDSKDKRRSWNLLLQLMELGRTDAFQCSELDMVLSDVDKVHKWVQNCGDVFCASTRDTTQLLSALVEIKNTLHRSCCIYNKSKSSKEVILCLHCSNDTGDRKYLSCSNCKDCFHVGCIPPSAGDENDGTLFFCYPCKLMESAKISRNGYGPLNIGRERPELNKLIKLLADSEDMCVWIEERSILHQIVEKALECNIYLKEIVDFALAYHDEDLGVVAGKLTTALKAIDVAGVYYCQHKCELELALARYSWRFRAQKLVGGLPKPTVQQIQRHLKEGLAIGISLQDYYRHRLTEVRQIGLQWADMAKKVSVDGGALDLKQVFLLIEEGENLGVYCEKELKLLRDRSMLYCICRRPYGQRAMIACDRCDEWYHFDCINLSSPPKIYVCPACGVLPDDDLCSSMRTTHERSAGSKIEEPQTPSPRRTELRKRKTPRKQKMLMAMDARYMLRHPDDIEQLLWRNRRPHRRATRKRLDLKTLSPFFSVQNN